MIMPLRCTPLGCRWRAERVFEVDRLPRLSMKNIVRRTVASANKYDNMGIEYGNKRRLTQQERVNNLRALLLSGKIIKVGMSSFD